MRASSEIGKNCLLVKLFGQGHVVLTICCNLIRGKLGHVRIATSKTEIDVKNVLSQISNIQCTSSIVRTIDRKHFLFVPNDTYCIYLY